MTARGHLRRKVAPPGGVVLLGLRLSLGDLVGLGATDSSSSPASSRVTFVGTQWLARRLGRRARSRSAGRHRLLDLRRVGDRCDGRRDRCRRGGDGVHDHARHLCGTLSIVVLPLLADVSDLTGEAFGTWVGGAVHDVGQVVATASTGEPAALEAATVVKLTRVVLLAPLVALIALRRRRIGTLEPMPSRRPPLLPLFVVGFLAAIVVRSAGVLERGVLDRGLVGREGRADARARRARARRSSRPNAPPRWPSTGARTAGLGARRRYGVRRYCARDLTPVQSPA